MENKIKFKQVNCDTYGNSRYVCHFLELINEQDNENVKNSGLYQVRELYNIAVNKARKIGGKKYNAKNYGGGIVFSCCNTEEIENKIKSIL
jgi:hypothetical protein